MRTYLAHIKATLKLTMRDKSVLFFNYLLPLLFFVVFAQSFGADRGGIISQVITMVLIMGVLGSGFFGAGLRAVQERELNILRRFKVAPITPLPLLVSSLVTGVITYLPSLAMVLLIARFYYGMPFPPRLGSLIVLLALGLVAFRSVGLTVAAVANSMQESQMIIQLLYLPMLFLSGATFPVNMLPNWLQVAAQFLPATYLYTGLNGILVRQESLAENWVPVCGMLATTAVALLLGVKLFRWEKEDRLPARAKLWLAAVMVPFLAMGAWQTYRKDNIVKAKVLYRDMKRNRALMIRGARIVVGDGKVIPNGAVLMRDGRIAEVLETVPNEKDIKAEVLEANGKTVLPGLIDAEVHLALPGGVPDPAKAVDPVKRLERELAAYLYCGVIAVRSSGDPPQLVRGAATKVTVGETAGADVSLQPNIGIVSTLAAAEAESGQASLLDRTLVLQVAPEGMIAATRAALRAPASNPFPAAQQKLLQAWNVGAEPAPGTGSGRFPLLHGPAIHRELQLWVQAGIPAEAALRAATSGNAKRLGLDARVGQIKPGMLASLLVVDGNPLEDIAATERISSVFFRGERVNRAELFQ